MYLIKKCYLLLFADDTVVLSEMSSVYRTHSIINTVIYGEVLSNLVVSTRFNTHAQLPPPPPPTHTHTKTCNSILFLLHSYKNVHATTKIIVYLQCTVVYMC